VTDSQNVGVQGYLRITAEHLTRVLTQLVSRLPTKSKEPLCERIIAWHATASIPSFARAHPVLECAQIERGVKTAIEAFLSKST
jgi:hypothetical protein